MSTTLLAQSPQSYVDDLPPVVDVVVPTGLDDEQLELVERLDGSLDESNLEPEPSGWRARLRGRRRGRQRA